MYTKEKTQQATQLIPRPGGERGKKGWTIRKALQLEGNTDLYLTILASVREAITASGLDWKKTFHRQDVSRLTDCYRIVCPLCSGCLTALSYTNLARTLLPYLDQGSKPVSQEVRR